MPVKIIGGGQAPQAPPHAKALNYIEDITRWREDMNFMFEWQEQYLTSERIKVASVKADAPPTSLETKTANATDASMLCQQNVKTMYFQTLKPRLFKPVI